MIPSKNVNSGKLYCTFLFSDVSEWELFVAKLLSEQYLVEHWFVVDGKYSFKGELIGLCARTLLQNEPRLTPLRSRITIIENEENFFEKLKRVNRSSITDLYKYVRNPARGKVLRNEKAFFDVEKRTRDLATPFILEYCQDSDWLLVTDVDEILDTSGSRSDQIREKLSTASGKFLRVNRLRYVFDFDNLDPQVKFCPIIQVSLLRGKQASKLSEFRFRQDGLILSAKPFVFEYSYCFDLNAIKRKLQNFAHVGPNQDMFSAALRLNHHFIQPGMNSDIRIWLQKNLLEPEFHATYIVEHITKLETGNVNPNYELARIIEFPHLFSI